MKILLLLMIVLPLISEVIIQSNASHAHKSSVVVNEEDSLDMDEYLPALCHNGVRRTRRERITSERSFDNCTIITPEGREESLKRDDVINYALENLDYNKDGVIDRDECETSVILLMPAFMRSFIPACSTIFERCDCNHDDIISIDDYKRSIDTCLGHCERVQFAYQLLVLRDYTLPKNGLSLK